MASLLDRYITTASPPTTAAAPSTDVAGSNTILDLIGLHESQGDYNRVFGENEATRNLTGMSVADVLRMQEAMKASGAASTAVGKYQFINKTLAGLVAELGLTGEEQFSPQLQDRLAQELLEQRGLSDYRAGKIDEATFMRELSKEWASLPMDQSGRGYYDDDGLNDASATPQEVAAALRGEQETPAATGPGPRGVVTRAPSLLDRYSSPGVARGYFPAHERVGAPRQSAFNRGIERGTAQTKGLIGQVLRVVGDKTGFAGLVDIGDDAVREAFVEAVTNPADIHGLADIRTPADVGTFVAQTLGEQFTNIGIAAVSGGFGAYLGRAAVGQAALRNIARRAVRDGFDPKELGKRFFRRFPRGAAGAAPGAAAGVFAGFLPINTGEIIQEQVDAGVDFRDIDLSDNLLLGSLSSSLEVAGFGLIGKAIFGQVSKEVADLTLGTVLKRIGHTSLQSLAAEGGTEAVQEAIVIASRKLNDPSFSITDAITSSEGMRRIAFAGFSGAVVGGVLGGGGGVASGTAQLAQANMRRARIRADEVRSRMESVFNKPTEEETNTATTLFDFDGARRFFNEALNNLKASVGLYTEAAESGSVTEADLQAKHGALLVKIQKLIGRLEAEQQTAEEQEAHADEALISTRIWLAKIQQELERIPTVEEKTKEQNEASHQASKQIKELLDKLESMSVRERAANLSEAVALLEKLTSQAITRPGTVPTSNRGPTLRTLAKRIHQYNEAGHRAIRTEIKKYHQQVVNFWTNRVNALKRRLRDPAEVEQAAEDAAVRAERKRTEPDPFDVEQAEEDAAVRAERGRLEPQTKKRMRTPAKEIVASVYKVLHGKDDAAYAVGRTVEELPPTVLKEVKRGKLRAEYDADSDQTLITLPENKRDIREQMELDFDTQVEDIDAENAVVVRAKDESGQQVRNEVVPNEPEAIAAVVEKVEAKGDTAEVIPVEEAIEDNFEELVEETENKSVVLRVYNKWGKEVDREVVEDDEDAIDAAAARLAAKHGLNLVTGEGYAVSNRRGLHNRLLKSTGGLATLYQSLWELRTRIRSGKPSPNTPVATRDKPFPWSGKTLHTKSRQQRIKRLKEASKKLKVSLKELRESRSDAEYILQNMMNLVNKNSDPAEWAQRSVANQAADEHLTMFERMLDEATLGQLGLDSEVLFSNLVAEPTVHWGVSMDRNGNPSAQLIEIRETSEGWVTANGKPAYKFTDKNIDKLKAKLKNATSKKGYSKYSKANEEGEWNATVEKVGDFYVIKQRIEGIDASIVFQQIRKAEDRGRNSIPEGHEDKGIKVWRPGTKKKKTKTQTSILNTILAPFKVARRGVGKPLPQEATEGICDGTCGIVTGRLKKDGFAYGKADIQARSPLGDWLIGHVVALASVNGEKYIINQPQGEFIESDFNIDNVWEDVFDPYRDVIKTTVPGDMRHHHAAAGINIWEMLTGKENIIDTDFGPMDVNQVENIQTYTENGETWHEANFIADKKAKIRWNEDTEEIEFKSSRAPAVFTNENFTPRLIKVDAETIAKTYGVDNDIAKETVAEINKIQLEPGKDITTGTEEEGSSITFEEDTSSGYSSRTYKNAAAADITIDFARTKTGSGGRSGMTQKAAKKAGKIYVNIPVDENGKFSAKDALTAIGRAITEMRAIKALHRGKLSVNIAGHGVYSVGNNQAALDEAVTKLLQQVHRYYPLKSVRSGGQTGFDEAGAKAGAALGVPTTVLAPKGFKFRKKKGVDKTGEAAFKKRFGVTEEEEDTGITMHLGEITTLGHLQRMGPGHMSMGKRVTQAHENFLYGLTTLRILGYEFEYFDEDFLPKNLSQAYLFNLYAKARSENKAEAKAAKEELNRLQPLLDKKILGNITFRQSMAQQKAMYALDVFFDAERKYPKWAGGRAYTVVSKLGQMPNDTVANIIDYLIDSLVREHTSEAEVSRIVRKKPRKKAGTRRISVGVTNLREKTWPVGDKRAAAIEGDKTTFIDNVVEFTVYHPNARSTIVSIDFQKGIVRVGNPSDPKNQTVLPVKGEGFRSLEAYLSDAEKAQMLENNVDLEQLDTLIALSGLHDYGLHHAAKNAVDGTEMTDPTESMAALDADTVLDGSYTGPDRAGTLDDPTEQQEFSEEDFQMRTDRGKFGENESKETQFKDVRKKSTVPEYSRKRSPLMPKDKNFQQKGLVTALVSRWKGIAKKVDELLTSYLRIKEQVLVFDDTAIPTLQVHWEEIRNNSSNSLELRDLADQYLDFLDSIKDGTVPARIFVPKGSISERIVAIYVSSKNPGPHNTSRGWRLAHELGHMVQYTHLDQLSPEVQAAFKRDFGVGETDFAESFANWMAVSFSDLGIGITDKDTTTNKVYSKMKQMFLAVFEWAEKHFGGYMRFKHGPVYVKNMPGRKYTDRILAFRDFVNAMYTHALSDPVSLEAEVRKTQHSRPLYAAILQDMHNQAVGSYVRKAIQLDYGGAAPQTAQQTAARANDKLFQNYIDNFLKFVERLRAHPFEAVKMLVRAADSELRAMGTFGTFLADQFHKVPGAVGNPLTVFREISIRAAPHFKRAEIILRSLPTDVETRKRINEALLLATPVNQLDADIRPHVTRVRYYMRKMYNWYTRDMGLPLRSRGYTDHGPTYFPMMIDTQLVEQRREDFVRILVQSGGFSEREAQNIRRKITRDGDGGLSNGFHADATTEDIAFFGPGFAAGQQRKWGPALRRALVEEGFYQQDIATTMIAYTEMMTRRAVWQKRYQNGGTVFGTASLREYAHYDVNPHSPIAGLLLAIEKAKHREQINDWQYERILKDILPAYAGQLGLKVHSKLRKIGAWAVIYQNIRLLGFAVLSSFVDVGTLIARDPTPSSIRAAFHVILDKATRQEKLEMLQAIGGLRQGLTEHVLNDQALNTFMTGRAKRINDLFFKYNQMEGWTNLMRAMALASAQEFILRNRQKALDGDQNATRYLAELGLSVADAMNWDGHSTSDIRIKAALNQYIDEAMIRPDPSIRPVWMSDPGYAVFSHLKGFLYGFHETFLRRVGREARIHHNLLPLIMLGILALPFAAVGYEVRRKLTGSKHRPEGAAYLKEVIERSGLPGAFQMVLDMEQADEYGKPFGLGIAGPTVEQLYDFMTKDMEVVLPKAVPIFAQSPVLRDWAGDVLR